MSTSFNRREFLQAGTVGVAAAALCGTAQAAEKDPYLGLKMGIQSYSLREFKNEAALEHTKALGLKFWESFGSHLPITSVPAQIQAHKDLLAKYGVTLISYGDRKSTRLNSSHHRLSRMPSSA